MADHGTRQRSRMSRAGLQTRLPGAPELKAHMAALQAELSHKFAGTPHVEVPRKSRKSMVTFAVDGDPRGSLPGMPRQSMSEPRKSLSGHRKSVAEMLGEPRKSLGGSRKSLIGVQDSTWTAADEMQQDQSYWDTPEYLDAGNYPSTAHYEAAARKQAQRKEREGAETTKTEQRTGTQRGLLAKAQELVLSEIAVSEERMWAWWEHEYFESKELTYSTAERVTALHNSCGALQKVIESLASKVNALSSAEVHRDDAVLQEKLAREDVVESLKAAIASSQQQQQAPVAAAGVDGALLVSLRKDVDLLSSEVQSLSKKDQEPRRKSIAPHFDDLQMQAKDLYDALRKDFESLSKEMRSLSFSQIDEAQIKGTMEKERLAREADITSLKIYIDQLYAHPAAKEQDVTVMNELYEQRRASEAAVASLRVDVDSLGSKVEKELQTAARVEAVDNLRNLIYQERDSRELRIATLRSDIEDLVSNEMVPQFAKQADFARLYEFLEQERRARDAALSSLKVDLDIIKIEAQHNSHSKNIYTNQSREDETSVSPEEARFNESYLITRTKYELARVADLLGHEKNAREAAIQAIRADVDGLSMKAAFVDGAYVDARYVTAAIQQERKARETAFEALRDNVETLSARYVNGVMKEERKARENEFESVRADIETLIDNEKRLPAATELIMMRLNELLEQERRAREASLISLRIELAGASKNEVIPNTTARLDDSWIKSLVQEEKSQRNFLCDALRRDIDRLSSEMPLYAYSTDVQEMGQVVRRLAEETRMQHARFDASLEPERLARISMCSDFHKDLDCLRAEIKCLPKRSNIDFGVPVVGEMQKLMETYRHDLNIVMNQLDQQGSQTSQLHHQLMQLKLDVTQSAAGSPVRSPASQRSVNRSSDISPVKLEQLLQSATPDKGLDSSLTAVMAKSAFELQRKTDEKMKRIANAAGEFWNDIGHSRSLPQGAPLDNPLPLANFAHADLHSLQSNSEQSLKPGERLRRATDTNTAAVYGNETGYPSIVASPPKSKSSSKAKSRHTVAVMDFARRDSRSESEISVFANDDYCQV